VWCVAQVLGYIGCLDVAGNTWSGNTSVLVPAFQCYGANYGMFQGLILYKWLQNPLMKAAFITYLAANQKSQKRSAKQNAFAIAQTAKEGRDLNEAALVNAR